MRKKAVGLFVAAMTLALAGCGSGKPPPLTGNLADVRGGHAGSFRGSDESSSNAAAPAGDNNQDAAR